MLGKRPRPPMKRTTSMTVFSCEALVDVEAQLLPPDHIDQTSVNHKTDIIQCTPAAPMKSSAQVEPVAAEDWLQMRYAGSAAARSGGGHRRYSEDFGLGHRVDFLRSCGLCKRRLAAGRDIFMYRGDIAFCSMECRQQQMTLDERKEKCSLTSIKDTSAVNRSEKSSSDGKTVAAA